MKIYLLSSHKDFDPVKEALQQLAPKLSLQIYQADYFNTDHLIVSQIVESIKNSDIVVADISHENANVYFELGIAHSFGKPSIIVSNTDNFSRVSILASRFYKYESTDLGIKNLAFRFEKILSDRHSIDELTPALITNEKIHFREFTSKIQLQDILKFTGQNRAEQFETWLYDLLRQIPKMEVEHTAKISKGGEYDFIVWNSTNDKELAGLGNPIPIEAKATEAISNDTLNALASKATIQGFRSLILVTTATISARHEKLVRDLRVHSGVSILVIGRDDLMNVRTPRDLFVAIKKSFRQSFVY